jgi:hypothetical protein
MLDTSPQSRLDPPAQPRADHDLICGCGDALEQRPGGGLEAFYGTVDIGEQPGGDQQRPQVLEAAVEAVNVEAGMVEGQPPGTQRREGLGDVGGGKPPADLLRVVGSEDRAPKTGEPRVVVWSQQGVELVGEHTPVAQPALGGGGEAGRLSATAAAMLVAFPAGPAASVTIEATLRLAAADAGAQRTLRVGATPVTAGLVWLFDEPLALRADRHARPAADESAVGGQRFGWSAAVLTHRRGQLDPGPPQLGDQPRDQHLAGLMLQPAGGQLVVEPTSDMWLGSDHVHRGDHDAGGDVGAGASNQFGDRCSQPVELVATPLDAGAHHTFDLSVAVAAVGPPHDSAPAACDPRRLRRTGRAPSGIAVRVGLGADLASAGRAVGMDRAGGDCAEVHQFVHEPVQHRRGAGRPDREHLRVGVDVVGQPAQRPSRAGRPSQRTSDVDAVELRFGVAGGGDDQLASLSVVVLPAVAVTAAVTPSSPCRVDPGDTATLAATAAVGAVADRRTVRTDRSLLGCRLELDLPAAPSAAVEAGHAPEISARRGRRGASAAAMLAGLPLVAVALIRLVSTTGSISSAGVTSRLSHNAASVRRLSRSGVWTTSRYTWAADSSIP